MIHRGVSVARRNFLAQQRGPAERTTFAQAVDRSICVQSILELNFQLVA